VLRRRLQDWIYEFGAPRGEARKGREIEAGQFLVLGRIGPLCSVTLRSIGDFQSPIQFNGALSAPRLMADHEFRRPLTRPEVDSTP